ncbi:MAG: HAMP domain-containing histidine kinase [Clostridiales bacterium]|nr:HAMP domain-containing histidine kinase [Clostridiales bacterium]
MAFSGKGKKIIASIKKQSILKKFCVFIIVAVIATSLISGIIMYHYTTKYMTESKSEDIKKAVDDVSILFSQMYTTYINNIDELGNWVSEDGQNEFEKYYVNLLDRLELYNNLLSVYGFITESDGSIFLSYPLLPNMTDRADTAGREYMDAQITSKLSLNNGKYYFKNNKQYYTGSDSEYVINTGDFYGLYSDQEVSYLSITQSIAYTYPGASEAINKGTITLSIPVPEITKTRSNIISYFLIATVISVALELIALFIITKEITEPIRELEKMTKQMAAGNFKVKIQSRSNDEVGELVNSYNAMAEALGNLDMMRNDFIASISHELRTPMTSIGGFIDGILDGVIPAEKQEHYLQIVKEEIARMNALVNDLLNMTRLQSGKVELDLLPCSLEELLRNTALKLKPIIDEKEIQIVFDIKTKNCEVLVDRPSIERVLINLIQNAVKFTNPGGTVTLHSEPDGKNKVRITVEDTGSGIAREEIPFIFEKFYKADKSRGLDKKGTGLGLAIVKNILSAHGQEIHVESTVGKGSRFIFTLPIYRKE